MTFLVNIKAIYTFLVEYINIFDLKLRKTTRAMKDSIFLSNTNLVIFFLSISFTWLVVKKAFLII